MTEQWQELKETIKELRDNDGTLTQQLICDFLVIYMEVLEKQMVEPQESNEKCDTCKYVDCSIDNEPCIDCKVPHKSFYEPRQEMSGGGEDEDR